MILKELAEDFIVDERYDINLFKEKEEENRKYHYFILTKKNYTQMRAIENVARIFNVSRKFINFAGTKDRVGITSQVISVFGIKEDNLEKNLDFFNENLNDLKLEFLGIFNGRINLGDNLGNDFKIVVRNLLENEIDFANKNLNDLNENGVLNFFDSQRFGYAGNSHIVGKYILRNEVELAVKEVLTSMPLNPKNPSLEHKVFVDKLIKNWDGVKSQNVEVLNNLIEIIPHFLRDEKKILNHLLKAKNDFPGAFRNIPKKIRTLYLNAYQSYIFNESINSFKNNLDLIELELVHKDYIFEGEIGDKVKELLELDNLTVDNFILKSMPELRLSSIFRKVRIFPKNINICEINDDEIYLKKKKVLVSFELDSGEYATNVVKQLFNNI